MNKYKYSREVIEQKIAKIKLPWDSKQGDFGLSSQLSYIIHLLLATTTPKEECNCPCHKNKLTKMCSFCCQNHKCNNCGGMGCQMCKPLIDDWGREIKKAPVCSHCNKPMGQFMDGVYICACRTDWSKVHTSSGSGGSKPQKIEPLKKRYYSINDKTSDFTKKALKRHFDKIQEIINLLNNL